MEAAVRVHGPLAVTARLGHRTFDSGDGALRTVRADVSYTVRVLGLDVCPTAGMARETLDALDITLIPMAVGITAPVPLGPATLWPYLAPGIVRSRASVPGHERVTTDFDVRLGATLAAGRLLVGAGWERRYTDEVDGVAFVRLGFGF